MESSNEEDQTWLGLFSLSNHHQYYLTPFHSEQDVNGVLSTPSPLLARQTSDLLGINNTPLVSNLPDPPSEFNSQSEVVGESELKSIAAKFLLDFSGQRRQAETQMQLGTAAPPPPSTEPTKKNSAVEGFGQRTSIYRGVTRHRWTGRYEAHLWDNSCRREGQSRKGRQVYLGGYAKEEKAAKAYDLAALKYWGPTTTTNFPVGEYEKELQEMVPMTKQELIASLRRKSSGFSRGASMYRGVTRHHQHGRWQARIGRVAGNKDLYLGTFSTQEEAAEAYDIAAIKFRGLNAVTNFDINRYNMNTTISSDGKSKLMVDSGQYNNNPTLDEVVVDINSSSSKTVFPSGDIGNNNFADHYTLKQQQHQQQQDTYNWSSLLVGSDHHNITKNPAMSPPPPAQFVYQTMNDTNSNNGCLNSIIPVATPVGFALSRHSSGKYWSPSPPPPQPASTTYM